MRLTVAALFSAIGLASQVSAAGWPVYGNTGGTRYSAAAQITPDNVARLEIAWQFNTGELERRSELANRWSKVQVNPILLPDNAGGHLIICTPFSRVIAIDPVTGKERWSFEPHMRISGYATEADPDGTNTPAFSNCRGVAFWQDNQTESTCAHRILLATNDLRLIAIDAQSGKACEPFGQNGTVYLEPEVLNDSPRAVIGEVKFPSPPTVINDVVVLGSAVRDNHRVNAPNGRVRAFDVRSGKPRWNFDPIPRDAGHPEYAGWSAEAAAQTGGANVWGMMTADAERDLIFLPTSGPSPDFYGATRPGDNRYADSIVALRGATGEVVWHFQTIHHDVWDYDNAAQPAFAELLKNGVPFPAVIQATKTGMLYIFHRETGEPFFAIEERAVPTDGMAGDQLSPTQPFPIAPPPLVPHGFSKDQVWGMTVFDKAACETKYANARYGDIFTPPSAEGTIIVPSTAGGVNWGGGGIDPVSKLYVVNVLNMAHFAQILPRKAVDPEVKAAAENMMSQATPILGTEVALKQEPMTSPTFTPCSPPPWAMLVAVDLQAGTIVWREPLGVLDKMMPMPLPLRWGAPTFGGPLVTGGGLTFIGSTADNRFRAFVTATGEEIWSTELPSGGFALPMSYEKDGRQFVVIASGPHPFIHPIPDDSITAFALPVE